MTGSDDEHVEFQGSMLETRCRILMHRHSGEASKLFSVGGFGVARRLVFWKLWGLWASSAQGVSRQPIMRDGSGRHSRRRLLVSDDIVIADWLA
jgi:hypothetical protein